MSDKKRSVEQISKEKPTKGYRIIAAIDRIEEFELDGEEDESQLVIVSTKTIGNIDAACNINLSKGKKNITLNGVNNVAITPDASVKVCATNITGKATINMSI